MEPAIISSYTEGKNLAQLGQTVKRLEKQAMHKDLSMAIIFPAHRNIHPRIMMSWMNMYNPPNQACYRLAATGQEVGEAYSRMVDDILKHISKVKYILTLEIDNAPPPDGIVKLLATMEDYPEYDAIGGLYFVKGEGAPAQIWGNPKELPINFRPQVPVPDTVQECNGTGMGFTMFRSKMFRDKRLRRPYFKTTVPGPNSPGGFTQDLYFWHDARQYGHRCAIDTRIKVNHYDENTDTMW